MLGVLAMLLATYGLGTFSFGGIGGLYSALALATSIGPFLFTRFLIPEVLVALMAHSWISLLPQIPGGRPPARDGYAGDSRLPVHSMF